MTILGLHDKIYIGRHYYISLLGRKCTGRPSGRGLRRCQVHHDISPIPLKQRQTGTFPLFSLVQLDCFEI
jgi:hypothetical protein